MSAEGGKTRPLRVLCVSPIFVPLANPEAFCGAKMALTLTDAGVDVEVLHDPRYLLDADSRRDASSMWESLREVSVSPAPPHYGILGAAYCAVRYRAYSRWADVAVCEARRLHSEKPFDLVYSRSLPMQAHVVGSWCARTLGVPWVANLNDPWDPRIAGTTTDNPLPLLQDAVSRYWLRRTLLTASLVTFPCRRLCDHTSRVARVGFASAVIPHVGFSVPAESDGVFRLVHAGILGFVYGRSAEGLLGGLKLFLEKRPEARAVTKLVLVGAADSETDRRLAEAGLSDVVETLGVLSYEDSLREIARASMCVVVEAEVREGIYLPSKFVDYVAARKPVLALSPVVGTVADMLPDPGLVWASVSDPTAIAEGIDGVYQDFVRGALSERQPSAKLVRTFDADVVAGTFLECLDRVGVRARRAVRRAD